MAEVVWPQSLVDLMLELPERDREPILTRVKRLESLPEMYPVRATEPYRGLRWFVAGQWLVYYRFTEGKVYVRTIWPARIP
jgi:hypothetical protein